MQPSSNFTRFVAARFTLELGFPREWVLVRSPSRADVSATATTASRDLSNSSASSTAQPTSPSAITRESQNMMHHSPSESGSLSNLFDATPGQFVFVPSDSISELGAVGAQELSSPRSTTSCASSGFLSPRNQDPYSAGRRLAVSSTAVDLSAALNQRVMSSVFSSSYMLVPRDNKMPDVIDEAAVVEGSVPPMIAIVCVLYRATRKQLELQDQLFQDHQVRKPSAPSAKRLDEDV